MSNNPTLAAHARRGLIKTRDSPGANADDLDRRKWACLLEKATRRRLPRPFWRTLENGAASWHAAHAVRKARQAITRDCQMIAACWLVDLAPAWHPVKADLALGCTDPRMTDARSGRPRYTIPIGAHECFQLTPTNISNRHVIIWINVEL